MEITEFENRITELVNEVGIPQEKDFLEGILLLKPKRTEQTLSGDFLKDLFDNYVMTGRSIGFDFNKRIEENECFIFFASQDVLRIGVNKNNAEIVMVDHENDVIRIAKNIENFIEIILIIFEYNIPGWCVEKKYTKEDRGNLYKKLERIIEPKYRDYYRKSYKD